MSETPAVPVDNTAQAEDQKAKDKVILDQAGKSADANLGNPGNIMAFLVAFLKMLSTGDMDLKGFAQTMNDTMGTKIDISKIPDANGKTGTDAPKATTPGRTQDTPAAPAQTAQTPAAAATDSTYKPVDLNTMSTSELANFSLAINSKALAASDILGGADIVSSMNTLPVLAKIIEENPDVKSIDMDVAERKFIVTGADGVKADVSYALSEVKLLDQDGNAIEPAQAAQDENTRISVVQDGVLTQSGKPPQEFLDGLRQEIIQSIEQGRKDPDFLKLEEAVVTGKPYEPDLASAQPADKNDVQVALLRTLSEEQRKLFDQANSPLNLSFKDQYYKDKEESLSASGEEPWKRVDGIYFRDEDMVRPPKDDAQRQQEWGAFEKTLTDEQKVLFEQFKQDNPDYSAPGLPRDQFTNKPDLYELERLTDLREEWGEDPNFMFRRIDPTLLHKVQVPDQYIDSQSSIDSDGNNPVEAADEKPESHERADKGYEQGVNGGALTFKVQTQPENVSVDLTGDKPSGLTGAFSGQVMPITATSVDAKVDQALVNAPAQNDRDIEQRTQIAVGLGR